MSKELLVALLEMALRYGVPAVLGAVQRCQGEITLARVQELVSLVPDPDSYDRFVEKRR